MCRSDLSSAMPSELMELLDNVATSDDAEEMRQLIPHLANFARQKVNS